MAATGVLIELTAGHWQVGAGEQQRLGTVGKVWVVWGRGKRET